MTLGSAYASEDSTKSKKNYREKKMWQIFFFLRMCGNVENNFRQNRSKNIFFHPNLLIFSSYTVQMILKINNFYVEKKNLKKNAIFSFVNMHPGPVATPQGPGCFGSEAQTNWLSAITSRRF